MADREWTQKNATLTEWDEPKTVEGRLIGKDTMEFEDDKHVGRYSLMTDEGQLLSFLGGAIIDSALADVEPGAFVKVVFTEKTQNKQGQPLNLFEVFAADAEN